MIFGSNATISVYRLALGTSIDNYPANATLSGVEAYIESKSSDLVQVLGDQGNIEVFDMIIDPIDIKTGDKVIDNNNREYRVMGVERHDKNNDVDDVYQVVLHSKKE
ncbi:hypothetical protein CVU83_01935 [Candidatus Falkowbacteria bacterium HGW-Falkowbacteria-2]|uniref:Head-tail adaptor protein n=1 Tax=Candidatus Falkowbacteria bacterium HGW-Falkowbacteria-2 TaxID=2013769 RepID=A0A2N2E0P0_9BACT|nr:MAG: hypothetical protein CVU83_01935 [Candidatus Falkowbacteria bacterium HGW-Falkowbacteria-2]